MDVRTAALVWYVHAWRSSAASVAHDCLYVKITSRRFPGHRWSGKLQTGVAPGLPCLESCRQLGKAPRCRGTSPMSGLRLQLQSVLPLKMSLVTLRCWG